MSLALVKHSIDGKNLPDSVGSVRSVFSSSEVGPADDPDLEQLCKVEEVVVAIVNFCSDDLVVEG
jgi:hypothetical protein